MTPLTMLSMSHPRKDNIRHLILGIDKNMFSWCF